MEVALPDMAEAMRAAPRGQRMGLWRMLKTNSGAEDEAVFGKRDMEVGLTAGFAGGENARHGCVGYRHGVHEEII